MSSSPPGPDAEHKVALPTNNDVVTTSTIVSSTEKQIDADTHQSTTIRKSTSTNAFQPTSSSSSPNTTTGLSLKKSGDSIIGSGMSKTTSSHNTSTSVGSQLGIGSGSTTGTIGSAQSASKKPAVHDVKESANSSSTAPTAATSVSATVASTNSSSSQSSTTKRPPTPTSTSFGSGNVSAAAVASSSSNSASSNSSSHKSTAPTMLPTTTTSTGNSMTIMTSTTSITSVMPESKMSTINSKPKQLHNPLQTGTTKGTQDSSSPKVSNLLPLPVPSAATSSTTGISGLDALSSSSSSSSSSPQQTSSAPIFGISPSLSLLGVQTQTNDTNSAVVDDEKTKSDDRRSGYRRRFPATSSDKGNSNVVVQNSNQQHNPSGGVNCDPLFGTIPVVVKDESSQQHSHTVNPNIVSDAPCAQATEEEIVVQHYPSSSSSSTSSDPHQPLRPIVFEPKTTSAVAKKSSSTLSFAPAKRTTNAPIKSSPSPQKPQKLCSLCPSLSAELSPAPSSLQRDATVDDADEEIDTSDMKRLQGGGGFNQVTPDEHNLLVSRVASEINAAMGSYQSKPSSFREIPPAVVSSSSPPPPILHVVQKKHQLDSCGVETYKSSVHNLTQCVSGDFNQKDHHRSYCSILSLAVRKWCLKSSLCISLMTSIAKLANDDDCDYFKFVCLRHCVKLRKLLGVAFEQTNHLSEECSFALQTSVSNCDDFITRVVTGGDAVGKNKKRNELNLNQILEKFKQMHTFAGLFFINLELQIESMEDASSSKVKNKKAKNSHKETSDWYLQYKSQIRAVNREFGVSTSHEKVIILNQLSYLIESMFVAPPPGYQLFKDYAKSAKELSSSITAYYSKIPNVIVRVLAVEDEVKGISRKVKNLHEKKNKKPSGRRMEKMTLSLLQCWFDFVEIVMCARLYDELEEYEEIEEYDDDDEEGEEDEEDEESDEEIEEYEEEEEDGEEDGDDESDEEDSDGESTESSNDGENSSDLPSSTSNFSEDDSSGSDEGSATTTSSSHTSSSNPDDDEEEGEFSSEDDDDNDESSGDEEWKTDENLSQQFDQLVILAERAKRLAEMIKVVSQKRYKLSYTKNEIDKLRMKFQKYSNEMKERTKIFEFEKAQFEKIASSRLEFDDTISNRHSHFQQFSDVLEFDTSIMHIFKRTNEILNNEQIKLAKKYSKK